MHIINIYGKDGMTPEDDAMNQNMQGAIQEEPQGLGRVPWVIRGDLNQEPAQVEHIWEIGGEIGRTGSATHEHGRELDWFMVSGTIRSNWTI